MFSHPRSSRLLHSEPSVDGRRGMLTQPASFFNTLFDDLSINFAEGTIARRKLVTISISGISNRNQIVVRVFLTKMRPLLLSGSRVCSAETMWRRNPIHFNSRKSYMSIPVFETARQAMAALDLYHDFYSSSAPFYEEKQRIVDMLRFQAENNPGDKFLSAFADTIEKM